MHTSETSLSLMLARFFYSALVILSALFSAPAPVQANVDVISATIQALLNRLRGQPVPGSNLLTELVVFMMCAPGYLPRLAWMERAAAYGRVRNALSQGE